MRFFKTSKYRADRDFDSDFFRDQFAVESQEMQLPATETRFLGKFISDRTLGIAFACIAGFLGILLAKAFYIQVVYGAYYAQLSETNRIRVSAIPASRGLVYDKNREPLVHNAPIFDARVTPIELPLDSEERAQALQAIADIIGVSPQQIGEILEPFKKTYKYPVTVLENIDYEQAIMFKIQAESVPGLSIDTRYRREYLSPAFSHLIGYEGKISQEELRAHPEEQYLFNDRIGKSGLELSYEQKLRGSYGFTKTEINVRGEAEKVLARQEPHSGTGILLSIDRRVQETVDAIIERHLRAAGKKRASAILMNPKNGEVLAMVSLPDYDNNLFAGGISADEYARLAENPNKPLFDRSVKGEYPSGSTIKPVVSAGALQDGIITDRTTVNSTGGIWVYDRWFFPDWAAGGHGLTNVYRAIAWSVNTFFYIVGGGYGDIKGLGLEGLKKYYQWAGLGVKTGIDLPGEATGLVPDEAWKKQATGEDWYIGDTYHLAIGQGYLLVTPLQVAQYTSIFANGGTLYRPHLVKAYVAPDGTQTPVKPDVIRENIFDQKNIKIVRTGMRQTVTNGSAQSLNSLPVSSAGKTGTAQWASNKATHAWYTGFAPYENPEVVVTVLVEEGGEGSQIAAAITRDILQWYFGEYRQVSDQNS